MSRLKNNILSAVFFIADYTYGRWPKDFAIFIFLINFFWASEKWWWTEKKKMHITMMAERENPCLISRPSMLRHNLMTKNALKKNAPIRSWWYLQLAFTCTYNDVHPLCQWPAKQACVVIIRSVIALSLDNLMAFYEMFMNVQVFQHNFFNDGCFF